MTRPFLSPEKLAGLRNAARFGQHAHGAEVEALLDMLEAYRAEAVAWRAADDELGLAEHFSLGHYREARRLRTLNEQREGK